MTESLKHTALHSIHEAAGARFTDFGGWDMPLRYESELAEHTAVRTHAGIFDLSHMGQLVLTGADAAVALNATLAGQFATMAMGVAKYSLLLTEDGGIVDDLIVYRTGEQDYLVVPNAANVGPVAEVFTRVVDDLAGSGSDVTLRNVSTERAILAIQGPASAGIVSELVTIPQLVEDLGYYRCVPAAIALDGAGADGGEVSILLARTGYTGEDGFEIYLPADHAPAVWTRALAVDDQLVPCGLTARDSLRLEAGMPLYGNELSRSITPAQAGLARVVKLDKTEDFPGKAAVAAASAAEDSDRPVLVGLVSAQRRAARAGSAVLAGDEPIGEVTSGQPSPTLQHPIALAYVQSEFAEPGTELLVDIRGKTYPFTVARLPFYRRPATS